MKIPWLTHLYVIVHKFKVLIEYINYDAISFISKYFYFFRLNHSIYTRADIVKKTMMTLLKSNYMPEKMR